MSTKWMRRQNRSKPSGSVVGAGKSSTNERGHAAHSGDLRDSKESTESKKTSTGSWLARVAAAVTVASVLTSLFGYGVVTGMAHSFGHDQVTLISSGFDLITMVWPGVFVLLTSLNKVLSVDLLIEAWNQIWVTEVVVGIAVFLAVFGLFWLRLKPTNALTLQDSLKASFGKNRTMARSLGWAMLASAMSVGVAFLFQALAAVSVVILFVLAVYVPSLGVVTGDAYVEKYVVAPKQCATPSNRAARLARLALENSKSKGEGGGAECVFISSLDPSKPFFRVGRSVIASSSALLLWNTESGRTHRVPLAGMGVSSIDEADFQQMHKLLAQYPASCLSLRGDGGGLMLKSEKAGAEPCK